MSRIPANPSLLRQILTDYIINEVGKQLKALPELITTLSAETPSPPVFGNWPEPSVIACLSAAFIPLSPILTLLGETLSDVRPVIDAKQTNPNRSPRCISG